MNELDDFFELPAPEHGVRDTLIGGLLLALLIIAVGFLLWMV